MPLRLLTALAVALLFVPPPARAADPDKYLPDDTDAVLTLNVRSIVDSPLFKKNYLSPVQKLLKGTPAVQSELKELGLDPFKDIDQVIIAHGEACHRTDQSSAGDGGDMIILRGRFDASKITSRAEALVKARALKSTKTPAGTLYEIELGGQPYFVGMPEKTAIVATPFKELTIEAMEKGSGKKKTQIKNKEMQALLQAADAKQGLWVAALGSMAYAIDTGKGKAKKVTLADVGVEKATGGIAIQDDVKSAFALTLRDAERATAVSGSLQQDLSDLLERSLDAATKEKKIEPLREFLRTLAIKADGKIVTLEGEVAGKVVEDSLK